MAFPPKFRFAGAHLLLAVLTSLPAHAFISLNEGSDHLYATGTASLAYDSNIFAHAGGEGDYIYSAGLIMEYSRRAGLIGVNASVAINASRFGRNPTQDFNNPAFTAEFIKSGGRTTGTLKLLAARESQADVVAGLRTESWNYGAGLKFKYPVIERYSFSGNLDYIDCVYDQPTALTDLQTYTAGTDLLYALTSARDLVAGYQFRRSETSSASSFDDHSFTAGVSGRILAKLNGSLRAGYEVRSPRGTTTDGAYRGLAASGSLTWTVSRTLTVNGQVSRDVSVTANNQSVNTTSGSLGLPPLLRRPGQEPHRAAREPRIRPAARETEEGLRPSGRGLTPARRRHRQSPDRRAYRRGHLRLPLQPRRQEACPPVHENPAQRQERGPRRRAQRPLPAPHRVLFELPLLPELQEILRDTELIWCGPGHPSRDSVPPVARLVPNALI